MNMAALIQEDLRQLGMRVTIVPLELRALLTRILDTHDYEAFILRLGSGDIDPNADSNVWLLTGETHLWDVHPSKAATPWQQEIDVLMGKQIATVNLADRKRCLIVYRNCWPATRH